MKNERLRDGEPQWALEYPLRELGPELLERKCVCGCLFIFASAAGEFVFNDSGIRVGRVDSKNFACPSCGRKPSTSLGKRIWNL